MCVVTAWIRDYTLSDFTADPSTWNPVVPAHAGIQFSERLDSRFRGNDGCSYA